MTNAAIILAAGRGVRAGGGLPKQWRELAGRTSVDHSVQVFAEHVDIDQIVLVLHADDTILATNYADRADIILTTGGDSRTRSVQNGLLALTEMSPKNVLIHDVARPCVPARLISDVISALDHHQAAAPAVPVSDALWRGDKGLVTDLQSRENLFAAQTPQGFDYETICAVHQAGDASAADDVAVARSAGIAVAIVAGDADNLKITTPGDFARAERILRGSMDIRCGNGFDVHAFEPGNHVVLCGVKVTHDKALKGHSDADVAMHALTDAIYGALAEGDIGQWFPPSDPAWKGAASDIFLGHAVELATKMGFEISHLDCTILCEMPKIGPHAQAMRNSISAITGLAVERVSIKATTTEQLGFTGRGEGIAASATATLVKP